MSGQRSTPEFKDEAAKLITERGYSVTDNEKILDLKVKDI